MNGDPGKYLHGDRGARIVVLPQSAARWIYSRYKLRDRGDIDNPEIAAALVALALAALEPPGSEPGSEPGSDQARKSEPDGQLTLTTSAAANRLDVTTRAVVKAIAKGKLPAAKVDGRWRIDPDDLDRHRPRQEHR